MERVTDWKTTAIAASLLRVSQRQVRYLIAAGDLRAKVKNPNAQRVTWLVYWPDVLAYDDQRSDRGARATE